VRRRSTVAVVLLILSMLFLGPAAASAQGVLQFDIPAESALLMEAGDRARFCWAEKYPT